MAPLGPLGPLGPPWGPWAPLGPHGAPWGPKFARSCAAQFRKVHKKLHFPILWIQNGSKKVEIEGVGPPSEIRAAIMRILAVSRSQMVARRPIWWQKGWIWGPLGFRAALAHPWAWGGRGGGAAKIRIQAKIRKVGVQIQGVSYAEFPLYPGIALLG